LWRQEFRRAVNAKAPDIAAVLNRHSAAALQALLSAPRNTIHAEQLRSIAYQKDDKPRVGLIKLGQTRGVEALKATQTVGGPERWGIVQIPEIPFEPYTYSTALIDVCFPLLCDLLELVEIKLFGPPEPSDGIADPEPDQLARIALPSHNIRPLV
jgi:hypothetical protein